MVSVTPWPLHPRGNSPAYFLNMRLVNLQNKSEPICKVPPITVQIILVNFSSLVQINFRKNSNLQIIIRLCTNKIALKFT